MSAAIEPFSRKRCTSVVVIAPGVVAGVRLPSWWSATPMARCDSKHGAHGSSRELQLSRSTGVVTDEVLAHSPDTSTYWELSSLPAKCRKLCPGSKKQGSFLGGCAATLVWVRSWAAWRKASTPRRLDWQTTAALACAFSCCGWGGLLPALALDMPSAGRGEGRRM
eukprot:4334133-Prymnesium_polylepis.1